MPCKTISLEAVATIGIDIGKNTFHLIGLDKMGAIVLLQKLSRNQVPTRRLQSSQPSRGRDRGVEACERGIMRVAIVAICSATAGVPSRLGHRSSRDNRRPPDGQGAEGSAMIGSEVRQWCRLIA